MQDPPGRIFDFCWREARGVRCGDSNWRLDYLARSGTIVPKFNEGAGGLQTTVDRGR
jgi:hypothetical protein